MEEALPQRMLSPLLSFILSFPLFNSSGRLGGKLQNARGAGARTGYGETFGAVADTHAWTCGIAAGGYGNCVAVTRNMHAGPAPNSAVRWIFDWLKLSRFVGIRQSIRSWDYTTY